MRAGGRGSPLPAGRESCLQKVFRRYFGTTLKRKNHVVNEQSPAFPRKFRTSVQDEGEYTCLLVAAGRAGDRAGMHPMCRRRADASVPHSCTSLRGTGGNACRDETRGAASVPRRAFRYLKRHLKHRCLRNAFWLRAHVRDRLALGMPGRANGPRTGVCRSPGKANGKVFEGNCDKVRPTPLSSTKRPTARAPSRARIARGFISWLPPLPIRNSRGRPRPRLPFRTRC